MAMSTEFDVKKLADLSDFEGSLAARVYQSLKQAILSLDAPPGVALRKPEMCTRFEVSRSPVAEAIARLSAEGLVEVTPQSGSRVCYLSLSDFHEAAFMRSALEQAAAERVAEVRSEADLGALARSMHRQKLLAADGAREEFYLADEAFHELIHAATGYARLSAQTEIVGLHMTRARRLLLPGQRRIEDTITEHQAIFDAIKAQDGAAARAAMALHLNQVTKLIDALSESQPGLFKP
ncbi:GntR family transcriptional regulator [Meridianimarinicoccus sp. MJW13]|uniref:GntR family transcriptional regulator n=1 Tax=Meridianimarinicoccus sp. MJW13 TaxID=2720031 RepID=UPI001D015F3C|nr:GntR family transcriptional regulator [Fluviibacterium sp. MJW13]